MERFAGLTGRRYGLFDYVGDPRAERVIVIMGSGAETVDETVQYLTERGEKVGVIKVRLFRPFAGAALLAVLPSSTRAIAVLDRTKEPGAVGDPLYLDVVSALAEARADGKLLLASEPRVVAGRYGLSSKEFTPAMVMAIFDELAKERPRNHFTIGIVDDVTHTSLNWNPALRTEAEDVDTALFYGLGADGTVGANKNSIKIIGEETDHYIQGYFVYDSKKSGAITISHLRASPRPIRSAYLITHAKFVACHQFDFVDKIDVLEHAAAGAVFLLNVPGAPHGVWERLPRELQQQMIEKSIRFFAIDAYAVAKETGMGSRINTIMQTCYFAISGVLPREEAIAKIKKAIEKTYGKMGADTIRRNFEAVDQTLARLHEIPLPVAVSASRNRPPLVSEKAPDFVQKDHRSDDGRQRRSAAGERLPRRRHMARGHRQMGEARHRSRDSGLGHGDLHPVQHVRAGLSARGDPRQGLRPGRAWQCSGNLHVDALQRCRFQEQSLHDPGRARGLHGLQFVRQCVPGQGPHQPAA